MATSMKRLASYSSLEGFVGVALEEIKLEEIKGTELQVIAFEEKMLERDERTVWGAWVRCSIADDETKKEYKFLTWSEVLCSQLKRAPAEDFPLLGSIVEAGTGTRKYLTFQ